MTPSLLDKQERDNANIKQNYIPPSAEELKTTDPEAWDAYVKEAVQYLNAVYPGIVTYDKTKDAYKIKNSLTLAFGKTDPKVQTAINIIDNYNPGAFTGKRTFDERVAKQVVKDTKKMPLNSASINSNIKTQVAKDVANYTNTVKLTNDMSAYFIAAMRLLTTKTRQKEAEQYYNAYSQYKRQLASTANNTDLQFISDYLFTSAVQKAGANILDVSTLNAQRKWLSDNKQKYNEAVARNNNITGTKLDKNSGIKSMQDVEKLVKEDK